MTKVLHFQACLNRDRVYFLCEGMTTGFDCMTTGYNCRKMSCRAALDLTTHQSDQRIFKHSNVQK